MRLNGIYGRNLANSQVAVIQGAASFSGPKALTVGGKEYTADHILIAVGGQPKVPDIPGAAEHAITSDGFFALEKQPKRVAVIGAGYIAVELAGVLHELGSDTTLVCRGEAPLRGFDDLIQATLVEEMAKTGLKLRNNSTPKVKGRWDARIGKPDCTPRRSTDESFSLHALSAFSLPTNPETGRAQGRQVGGADAGAGGRDQGRALRLHPRGHGARHGHHGPGPGRGGDHDGQAGLRGGGRCVVCVLWWLGRSTAKDRTRNTSRPS